MKSEQDTAQTAPTFSAAQWGSSQIPIDPALQQQTPPAANPYYYAQHYSQSSYGHYHQYTPQHTAQTTQPAQPTQPTQPVHHQATLSRQNTQSNANAMDTADIATLNDALGSAGVDLRAEEESLQRSYDQYPTYRPYEDRSRKQPPTPNFDSRVLGATMRAIGTQHKVTRIPEDSVNYVALALRVRLQELITAMIAASQHRTDTQFDRPASCYEDGTPMWSIVVRSDIGKQLAVLERVEREEEMKVRRERKERLEAAAAQSAALAAQGVTGMAVDAMDEDGAPKKKKKKDGPGVTARNMSEDVRKKMSNAVASQAAGLGTGKYAWMNAASATSAAAKPKPAATPGPGSSGATTPATTTAPAASTTSSGRWARPYVPTKPQSQAQQREEDAKRAVTMRDALFVIENERGHGGGRGSARGWT